MLLRYAFFFLLALVPLQAKFGIFRFMNKFLALQYPFPPGFRKHWYFYLTDLPLLVFAGVLLFAWRKNFSLFFTGSRKYLSLFFGAALVSLVLSQAAGCPLHYLRLAQLLLLVTFFCALDAGMIFKNVREIFPKICSIVVLVSLFECSIALLQYMLQKHLSLNFLGEGDMEFRFVSPAGAIMRASGTFLHPNVFGGFLAVAIPMSYFLLVRTQKSSIKILLVAALFFQLLALTISFSRAALVAWFLSTLLFAFLCKRPKVLWVSLGAFALCLFLYYPAIHGRGGVVNYNQNAHNADQGRMFFQDIALSMIQKNPIFGVGYNNYLIHMQEFSSRELERLDYVPVHNIFLLAAAETGLVGLLFFLLFIYHLIKGAWKKMRTLEGATLMCIFAGLLFIGCCDFYLLTTQHGQLLFFTIAGLVGLSAKEQEIDALT